MQKPFHIGVERDGCSHKDIKTSEKKLSKHLFYKVHFHNNVRLQGTKISSGVAIIRDKFDTPNPSNEKGRPA
jgi:hypothetical protein